jgi:transcriptional repressor NrdR
VRCPYCGTDDDRVVDSRPADDGAAIRRRRECRSCGQRFSTFERPDVAALAVRKRDGTVEPFDRQKVLSGMEKAVKNLAVSPDLLQRAGARVEARVRGLGRREVPSEAVGSEVLAALRDLDHVAYLRFASVYKGFTSAEEFRRELEQLEAEGGLDRVPPSDPGS